MLLYELKIFEKERMLYGNNGIYLCGDRLYSDIQRFEVTREEAHSSLFSFSPRENSNAYYDING